MHVVFLLPRILQIPPQLWRLVTPFFLTGGGIGFFLDLYFLFQYASDIEVNSPRFSGPGDFVTYVIFVAIFILVSGHSFLALREGYKHGLYPVLSSLFAKHLLNLPAQPILAAAVPEFEGDYPCTSCIPIIRIISILQELTHVQLTAGLYLQSFVFLGALSLAFLTTLSQDNAGKKMAFIFFQIPAEYLPFASLIATLVLSGQHAAITQACGILAAHLYEFLTRIYPDFGGGTNYIQTPRFIQNLFGSSGNYVKAHGGYRKHRPADGNSSDSRSSGQSTGSWFSGLGGGSWKGRGAGRKLGTG
ncbi:hypothetical protein TRV_07914 [Trichophyton verrucosum HKI 0517]|uniref:Derlin n=1 Tax=Trichophyton verrucosum (strain HKI 0517) TaxID=663202 RepID=D4DL40_TRIVH|nr:uncharacterized protein TRV_07914 [Trichophyton verrucosum HKI 0517]EFE37433.1 hypothetical protein TRV_07914 [Trichophyton verrucosum HKI 0517]